jgi:hypothetical protein
MTVKTTVEQRKLICDGYVGGRSLAYLGGQYGISNVAVSGILQRRGISRRSLHDAQRLRVPVDEAVFSGSITEASAYWVGFLMGDGSVYYSKYSKHLSLGVSIVDINHIYKFREFLHSGHTVSIARRVQYNNYKGQDMAVINIASHKLVESLEYYGVVTGKTFRTVDTHGLENDKNFWRGLVDADGCIYEGITDSISLCGTKRLMNQFLQFARTIEPRIKSEVRATDNVYVISINGKYARRIISELYTDSNIYLDRKYEKAMSIVEGNR